MRLFLIALVVLVAGCSSMDYKSERISYLEARCKNLELRLEAQKEFNQTIASKINELATLQMITFQELQKTQQKCEETEKKFETYKKQHFM